MFHSPAAQDAGARPAHDDRICICENAGCRSSWDALVEDSDCPIAVGDLSGHYLAVNKAFCDMLGADRKQVVGSSLRKWFSSAFSDERILIRKHVAATQRVVRVLDMVRGKRYLSIIRPFNSPEYPSAVITTLAARAPDASEIPTLHPVTHTDLGPLETLTPREFEVLRMIGEGYAQREIADVLHRTVKTVEAHRASLGRKLNVKKNIQLVQIALAAGLLDAPQQANGSTGPARIKILLGDEAGDALHVER